VKIRCPLRHMNSPVLPVVLFIQEPHHPTCLHKYTILWATHTWEYIQISHHKYIKYIHIHSYLGIEQHMSYSYTYTFNKFDA
jgi:hypothetical protein